MSRIPSPDEKTTCAEGAAPAPARTGAFDYDLPPGSIAQVPLAERDASRLLVLARATGAVRHAAFSDLPDLLFPGDLVVVNDTRVIPARVELFRRTGGRISSLFLGPADASGARWLALLDGGGRLSPGEALSSGPLGATVVLVESRGGGEWLVELSGRDAATFLDAAGRTPLPPYVRRARGKDPRDALDRERYQTIFARNDGAVAAPTAGLHFSESVLDRLSDRGIGLAHVTLHVGAGTFRPMKAESVGDHRVDPERFRVGAEAARAVNETRGRGGRVVAVGTTTVRALESAARSGRVAESSGETDLFIREPFHFRAVDALVTNFHQPRSSLLVLVAAFAGRNAVLAAYGEAVRAGYRFLSYGDAMLVA